MELDDATLTALPATPPVPTQLVGNYHHQVDAKGRVFVPAALRRGLPDNSVVAPAARGRLFVWPPAAWEEHQTLYLRTAETAAQEAKFLRWLVSHAFPFDVDTQGRLLLSPWQREWAHISDRVVFAGLTAGVEISAEQTWIAEEGEPPPEEFDKLSDLVWQLSRSGRGAGS
ncbi:MAG: hypothetical protein JOZ92_03730 [Candidatus Dormibacteraeota bacterium]|nr:hypothetical protein [Candidatus Dormibacteraeota bacterium]